MTKTKVFDAVTLTTVYTGNESAALPRKGGRPVLLIDYAKGTETSMEVQLEIAENADVTTIDYYLPSDDAGASLAQVFTVGASGKYRVAISEKAGVGPLATEEQSYRLSAKGTGTVTGTLTLFLLESADDPPKKLRDAQ